MRNSMTKYLYPNSHFDLLVIADQLQHKTIETIKEHNALVHIVNFKKSTKVKSLQSAISSNQKIYDAIVVLDADNLMEINFLNKANHYLNQGHNILQGNRKAANKNSAFALLDGLSEAANTKMLCQGANQLGLSSKLSGSGMVFSYQLFADAIMEMTAIGGFDKELELHFTKNRRFIHYADDLIVFDEKIADANAFARQRGRWLQAQYSFFMKAFKPAIKDLFKGNFDYLHKTMQLALPPRALSPFALIMLTSLAYAFGFQFTALLGLTGLILTIGSYFLVLSMNELFVNSFKLINALPALFISVFKSLRIMKKAKREFLHTEHKINAI